jgi:hypothetical protein
MKIGHSAGDLSSLSPKNTSLVCVDDAQKYGRVSYLPLLFGH